MSTAKKVATAPPKTTLRVKKQVVLPFGKSLEISIKSLKARFFRNAITVMTLVLAVSFLSFTLVTNDIASGIAKTGTQEAMIQLEKAGFDGAIDGTGMSAKERWIVFLSLLVCTVGILNAQLMSVTERFREIGTMKCLGALDSFVLRLFLLEAGFQGFVGAFAGSFIGALVAFLAGVMRFGFGALSNLALASFMTSIGLAVGTGLLLSLAGVFYPAIIASRMKPVEAMRAEN